MNFKKIKKMLIKYGVSEEEADGFISDLQAEPEDDEESEEVHETEGEVEEKEPEVVDGTSEEVEEKVEEKVDEEQVEETPDDNAEQEVSEEPQETVEEPVQQEVEEPAPTEDLRPELEEYKKALDGLCAKVDSLVESLEKTGVLNVVHEQPVGVDENSMPATEPKNDAMASFLAKANRRR